MILDVGHGGIPALVNGLQLVIEHFGTDLDEQMCTPFRPAHLLLFDKPFADNVIDSRFHERRDSAPPSLAHLDRWRGWRSLGYA